MANPEPFILRPTPNPNEFAFVTYVRAQWDVDLPVDGVTLYRDWKSCIYPQAAGDFGGYVYADSVEAPADWLGFLWVKKKTEQEKKTPFREWNEKRNHHWPAILQSIKFFQDAGFPRSTNGSGGSVIRGFNTYVRYTFIPSQDEGSRFLTKLFLSDTPFEIPQSAVPMPTVVAFDFLGVSGSFPESLHRKIIIPPVRTAFAKYSVGGGDQGVGGGVLPGQVFPETNFDTWRSYIVSDTQDHVEGQWVRTQVRVYPPPLPDPITR